MSDIISRMASGKMPPVIGVVAVVVCLAIVAVVVVGGCGSSGGREATKQTATCEVCGHTWQQGAAEQVLCPQCQAAGIMKTSYVCPRCKEQFVGLESKKLGMGKFRYRRAGQDKWQSRPPAKLKCSHCGFESKTIYSRKIDPESPGGEQLRRRS